MPRARSNYLNEAARAKQTLQNIERLFATTYRRGGEEITTDLRYLLEGVILDFERTGSLDVVNLRSLKDVRKRLDEIAKLLGR